MPLLVSNKIERTRLAPPDIDARERKRTRPRSGRVVKLCKSARAGRRPCAACARFRTRRRRFPDAEGPLGRVQCIIHPTASDDEFELFCPFPPTEESNSIRELRTAMSKMAESARGNDGTWCLVEDCKKDCAAMYRGTYSNQWNGVKTDCCLCGFRLQSHWIYCATAGHVQYGPTAVRLGLVAVLGLTSWDSAWGRR
jgi:hypothetical protein